MNVSASNDVTRLTPLPKSAVVALLPTEGG